ncbi:MAG: glycosyltransferase family 4 protein [Patescibacteria group bacterium]|jgi:glycosyltransferase involved in cell wall biosynthesis
MKILLGITYYLPNISGVTIYARRLAEGLVKKGHQVTVLTSWHNKTLPQKEIINGVGVVRSPVFIKIGKGVLMPFLPFQILELLKDCDVVNCHLPQFESFVFAFLGKLFGKKVILTHHTDLSGWKGLLNQLSEFSVLVGQIIAAYFADLIVPYTKDYADYSNFLKKFSSKLRYILPPIVTEKVDHRLRDKWKKTVGGSKYVIGFAGRIARQKGIPYLLKSIEYFKKDPPSFKVVFAGPYKKVIGENYFAEIETLIDKYKENIIFLGDIPEEKMSTFYSLCDVLVLPSDDRLESFGLVQVEAMLNGCPVVATDLPGVRIPVKLTGMGLIVPAGDPQSLAKAVTKILENRKTFLLAKEKITKVFDFQETLSNYEKIFI